MNTAKTHSVGSPQVILLDGATGSGKSTILGNLRHLYSERLVVGTKYTTRSRRLTDNDWEFRFVESVPKDMNRYKFTSVGNEYAINEAQLRETVNQTRIYAISCVDAEVMQLLSANYRTLTIYIYRPQTEKDLNALLDGRGGVTLTDKRLREEELTNVSKDYARKLRFYSHVVLNIGTVADMLYQVETIFDLYSIYLSAEA